MLTNVKADNFQELVLDPEVPVVVDFSAEYCGPCKKLAPILAELADELKGKVDFYEVDAAAEASIAQKYGVMSLPTILIFKNGDIKERVVGLIARDKLLKKINKLV